MNYLACMTIVIPIYNLCCLAIEWWLQMAFFVKARGSRIFCVNVRCTGWSLGVRYSLTLAKACLSSNQAMSAPVVGGDLLCKSSAAVRNELPCLLCADWRDSFTVAVVQKMWKVDDTEQQLQLMLMLHHHHHHLSPTSIEFSSSRT